VKHRSLILGLVHRNYGRCQNVFSRLTAVNFQLNAVLEDVKMCSVDWQQLISSWMQFLC